MLLLERQGEMSDATIQEEKDLEELREELEVEKKIRGTLEYELELSRKTNELQMREQFDTLRSEIESKYEQWRAGAEEELKLSLREELLQSEFKQPEEKMRSEEHTSELQSQSNLVCRLLLEK